MRSVAFFARDETRESVRFVAQSEDALALDDHAAGCRAAGLSHVSFRGVLHLDTIFAFCSAEVDGEGGGIEE
jgi:hypothetical protein